MRTRKRIVLALCGAVSLAVLAFQVIPGPIEGCWKYIRRVNCLCGDSYNFIQFHDGKIQFYSSHHGPSHEWGRYERSAWNRYRIRTTETENEPVIHTLLVRPTLLSLRIVESDTGDGDGFFQNLIYRVVWTGQSKKVIAEDKSRAANKAPEDTARRLADPQP